MRICVVSSALRFRRGRESRVSSFVSIFGTREMLGCPSHRVQHCSWSVETPISTLFSSRKAEARQAWSALKRANDDMAVLVCLQKFPAVWARHLPFHSRGFCRLDATRVVVRNGPACKRLSPPLAIGPFRSCGMPSVRDLSIELNKLTVRKDIVAPARYKVTIRPPFSISFPGSFVCSIPPSSTDPVETLVKSNESPPPMRHPNATPAAPGA